MPSVIWFLLGIAATHLFYAALCIGWWFRLVREKQGTTADPLAAVGRDFDMIRKQLGSVSYEHRN